MSEFGELGIWLVRQESESLGTTLQTHLGGELYRPWLNAPLPQKEQFAAVYRQYAKWVMVTASGIAVRFLDGLPQDKHSDPAVVVVDEAGRYAVSLLAGHEGGANGLAYRVASAVGAVPVVTTATEALKPLVVGIGCRKGATVEQIETAVKQALGERSVHEVREVATIDLKANEPGLLEFCERHGLALRVFARDTVAARSWVSKPSDWVKQNVGVDGVCEPCALLAFPRGHLLVPKMVCDGVAVAILEDKV
ncbi:MAG: cobalamin biosynthesis protein CbiG [Betaproteobacteria bacterium HGW-Betaproteobacteria-11]|nr:MAG: cobalamin biosynthesis protein CbiG [Betaproteobacteria bacterium HGW-Betaproteobacteria-11]